MEIKLLKPINGNASGDVIDVTPEKANYLVRCNAAVYTDGVNSPVTPKQVNAKATAKSKAPKQNKLLERQKALAYSSSMISKLGKDIEQVKPKLEKK